MGSPCKRQDLSPYITNPFQRHPTTSTTSSRDNKHSPSLYRHNSPRSEADRTRRLKLGPLSSTPPIPPATMAPANTPGRKKRENNFFDIGVQGIRSVNNRQNIAIAPSECIAYLLAQGKLESCFKIRVLEMSMAWEPLLMAYSRPQRNHPQSAVAVIKQEAPS